MNQLQSEPPPPPRSLELDEAQTQGSQGGHLWPVTTRSQRTHPRRHCLSMELWRQNVFAWRREPRTHMPQTKAHSPHPGCVSACHSATSAGQSRPLQGPSNSSYLFLGGFGARAQKHLPLSRDHLPASTPFTVTREPSLGGPCAINTPAAPLAPSTASSGCREAR